MIEIDPSVAELVEQCGGYCPCAIEQNEDAVNTEQWDDAAIRWLRCKACGKKYRSKEKIIGEYGGRDGK